MSDVVSARKNVLSKRYRWKMDVLSGSLKNAKCVLDVFTDVRNLQSAMAMVRQSDMDSIIIRTPEFRKSNLGIGTMLVFPKIQTKPNGLVCIF